jgi:hypothetical protein
MVNASDTEDEVRLSFLPSPRLEEGLQKVGLREDLVEFVALLHKLLSYLSGLVDQATFS